MTRERLNPFCAGGHPCMEDGSIPAGDDHASQ
jgi:hypothetical protein